MTVERGFRNWDGYQGCRPAAWSTPVCEDELVAAVKLAASRGQRVKMVGSGHSFTGAALTDGVLIRPDRYRQLLEVDGRSHRVTVQAGITLAQLNRELAGVGLALPNLGDIEYQTVAGAVSTGTHGTGVALGTLSTQVVAMSLVASDGTVVSCSTELEPELFRAARTGIGALGVISTMTLQCRPAFNLHAVEASMRLDAVLDDLDHHVDDNDHFELFWIPHTGWALTKSDNVTATAATPRGRWRSFRDDILLANVAFGAVCRLGRRWPTLTPRLAKALPASGRVEYVERSDRVFTSPRLVKFHEMEYAIPRTHAVDAVRAVRDYIERSGLRLSFPVEVRFTAADDITLSPASGRDTCYIAVHVYRGTPYQQYFEAVESIMNELDGRPHWGKLHFQTAATLEPRYPGWAEFQSARRRIDPDGRFSNEYTDRVLGSV